MLPINNKYCCSFNLRNWLGQLKLCFAVYHGRSVLVKCWHRGPFFVQKPFYHEDYVPHVYLLHPPGGLVGGDHLSLNVDMGVDSQALLTMPGSTKFYRSDGSYVYLQQRFNLNKNSVLEWLPQSNVFFSFSKVIIDSIFTIAEGARCIFFETLCFGHSSWRWCFKKGILNFFLSISLSNSIGLKERIKIDGFEDLSFCKFAGYRISAIFFAVPGDVHILHNMRNLIEKYSVDEVCGATLLDNLLVVRILGNNNERIQMLLRTFWSFLRPIIIGKQPVIPRVWLT